MLITLALLVLWILSMYFYLPIPVVVLLFVALVTGVTLNIWVAILNRRQEQAIIEQDSRF